MKPSYRLPHFLGGTVEDGDLFRRIQDLHRQSEQSQSLLAIEEGLLRLLVELLQRHATAQLHMTNHHSANHAVRHVREYLEAHFAAPISLFDLSKLVYISPYHLSRSFTKAVGISPHQYLDDVRIRHAERLLSTGMSIAAVAYATGFSDQSHLTRTFKRHIGTTPGKFLQQRKIVQDSASPQSAK